MINELAVMGSSSLASRSSDSGADQQGQGGYVDAKDVQANAIKVVTERGTVYLMGRVTEREANARRRHRTRRAAACRRWCGVRGDHAGRAGRDPAQAGPEVRPGPRGRLSARLSAAA